MLETTGISILAFCALAYSCGGMSPCPKTPELDDPGRIATLRTRISASSSVFLVLPPVKDTLKVALDSKVDSICSVDFRIARFASEMIPLQGNGFGKSTLLHSDTLNLSFACPNRDCVRDYACSSPLKRGRNGEREGLQCGCDGLYYIGGGSLGTKGCGYFSLELGKDAGGILFGSEDAKRLGRVSKECPTDVLLDAWIPVMGDSLEIRTLEKGTIAVRKLALSDVLDRIPGAGRANRPGPR